MRSAGVLVLLMLVSAGCLAALSWQVPSCELEGRACTATDDGWLLEDIELEGDARLTLRSGPVLTIRNVTITGADRIDLDVMCACTIRGEGFTVEGLGAGAYAVWLTAGQGSRTEMEDGVRLDGITVSGLGRGIMVGPSKGAVTIANATVSCPAGGGAFEFDASAITQGYRIHDSTTTGCASVSISKRPEGTGPLQVEVARSHLQGSAGSDRDGISPTAGTHLELHIVDSTISNVRYALSIREGESLSLQSSTVSDTDTAIALSDDGVVFLNDVTLQRNGFAIRAWDGARLEATRTTFLDNGDPPLSDCRAAVSGELSGWIHGSTFEGNHVALDVFPMGFDATGNYWASPTGPVPFTGCQTRSGAVQQVSPGVSYVPFLAEAP